MKLDDLHSLADTARQAAREAGAFIRSQQGRAIAIENKEGGQTEASQVVTEVDRQAQDMILTALADVTRTFDLATLAEESEDDRSRLEQAAFWAIDPLDGTWSFLNDIPGFSVSIGLVGRDGRSLIGVIYDPSADRCYSAVAGGGVWRDATPWLVEPSGGPLTCFFDRSFTTVDTYEPSIAGLERIATSCGFDGIDVTIRGGAALNACQVAEQGPACYFKYPRPQPGGGSIWDFAASSCIYNELGLPAIDFVDGSPLFLNHPDSTFMNHCGVIYTTSPDLADRFRELHASLEAVS